MITMIFGAIKGRVIQNGFHETHWNTIWHYMRMSRQSRSIWAENIFKLSKVSSFVAASIPHSFLNSAGKPVNRWMLKSLYGELLHTSIEKYTSIHQCNISEAKMPGIRNLEVVYEFVFQMSVTKKIVRI